MTRFSLAVSSRALRTLALIVGLFSQTAQAASDPHRVVVLGGSITEILYLLKAEDRIVGVDTTSLTPPNALKDKPNVGYVRALSAEGVLSLKPDLVLAIPDAGPRDALDLVRGAGIPVTIIPDDPSPDGITRKIEATGAAVGRADEARALAQKVSADFKALDPLRATIGKPRRVLFLLSLQNGRSMVAGRKTSADGMIRLAGAVNAAGDMDGFKTMSDEAISAAAPDVVLVMKNAGRQIAAADVFKLPAYQATPAGAASRFVAMDGLFLLGFGPRTPEAARALIKALYPDLSVGVP